MSSDLDEDQLLADSSEEGSSDEESVGEGTPGAGSLGGEGGISLGGHQRAGAASFFASAGADEDDDDDDSGEGDAEEDMDVDEEVLQSELDVVNNKLASEPYSYDLYLEKIRILKGLGELDKLRSAREKMNVIYPLSPTLWIEWLQDEQKMLSVATDEEKEYVFTLMERAVKDYTSVEVWLEYINLCLSNMNEENGVVRCRDVFERALGCCGLNVAMGSLIWDTYRDFEAALLATMVTEEQQLEQEKRFIALCKRQLAVPLLGMKNTFNLLKNKIDIDENVESAYKKALDRLKYLESWEAKLVQTSEGSQKSSIYNDYIAQEQKFKSNPARIQCLYERAITDSPLDAQLWLDYIDYLTKDLKIPDLIMDICERAVRNCSWTLTVWLKYLWAVETFIPIDESIEYDDGQRFDKMKTVFEKALTYCGTGDQAGTLWLKYLEFLRRRIDYEKSLDPKKVEILRKTFTAAETHLLQLVQEPNDFISQILQFQARFESNLIKGMTGEIREMWKAIFNRGYGQYYRVWAQYLTLEIKYGADVKRVRAELGRAMLQIQDDPQSVADFWLNFERDYGDLISQSVAEAKISKALENMVYPNPGQNYTNKNYGQKDYRQNNEQGKNKKRKWQQSDEMLNNAVPPKREKPTPIFDTVDGLDNMFKMPAVPKPKFVKSSSNDSAKTEQPPPGPVKHDSSKDNRTVFVSNLHFSADESMIKGFFSEVGTVEEVRLVKDFKLRSKGFGYVVFEKLESHANALKMDRKPLEGRPVFVSKCDPDKNTRQVQFKYSTALEKNKLFVKGLPFSMSQEDLRKLFAEFGALKDCRLVANRTGRSKGIAYLEFENASHAAAAILKTDGSVIDGRTISVSISNPPAKNEGKSIQPSYFSKATATTDPLQRRERNVFVPRSLQVHPKSDAPTADLTTNPPPTAPKSNDDFRKLFMKK